MRLVKIVLAAGALAALSAPLHAQDLKVRIGLSSPLSGGQASNGQDNRDGALLAINQLNAKGVMVGQKKVQFELAAQDDGADPRQGVTVAQTLADDKIKFVLGPYNSGVAIPASRVYNDAGVVVATVASNPQVTQQNHARLFRVGASDLQLGVKMAVYASKELKIATVAVVDDRTSYGQGVAKEFANEATRLGIKVVSTQFTTDKATDFSPILTAIRSVKPDAIFFGGYSAQAGPMLRQMKGLGVQAKLLGGDGICSTETARLSGGPADNVLCTQGGALLDKADAGRNFLKAYRDAYKRDPLTYAVAFYDAAMMLADAMSKAGSIEPGPVSEFIAKGAYQGVAGEYSFDAKHDLKSSAVTVFTFKDGQPSALMTL
jgi:branched-chain amino acid transport system substrate-binding protein